MRTHGICLLLTIGLLASACAGSIVHRIDYKVSLQRTLEGVPSNKVEATVISLAADGCGDLAVSDGVVWVVHRDRLSRIDAGTKRVIDTIPIPTPGQIAVEGDTVWLSARETVWLSANPTPAQILRIDTRTKNIVARIPGVSGALAVGEGAVWVTNGYPEGTYRPSAYRHPGYSAPDKVLRIDPMTNTVAATVELGNSLEAVAAGAGRVWVLQTDGSVVVPFAALAIQTWDGTASAPTAAFAVGAGALWTCG